MTGTPIVNVTLSDDHSDLLVTGPPPLRICQDGILVLQGCHDKTHFQVPIHSYMGDIPIVQPQVSITIQQMIDEGVSMAMKLPAGYSLLPVTHDLQRQRNQRHVIKRGMLQHRGDYHHFGMVLPGAYSVETLHFCLTAHPVGISGPSYDGDMLNILWRIRNRATGKLVHSSRSTVTYDAALGQVAQCNLVVNGPLPGGANTILYMKINQRADWCRGVRYNVDVSHRRPQLYQSPPSNSSLRWNTAFSIQTPHIARSLLEYRIIVPFPI